MSGSSLPYQLRPNKAVDRELFLSLLGRLQAALQLEYHKYVGLGGPFLEDFRLIHARTGISKLVCVEQEAAVHQRQQFNRPTSFIECVHSSLEDYLAETDFLQPVVLWLDYTDPKEWQSQIDCFCEQAATVPPKSVIRLTLNANPGSLGNPDINETVPEAFEGSTTKPTLQAWRLERFKRRIPDGVPADVEPDDMTNRRFGAALLKSVNLAMQRYLEGVPNRKVIWALATHYSDGQAMATATVVITDGNDSELPAIVDAWPFASAPSEPLVLDLPALSTLERLTLEGSDDPRNVLGYNLPGARLKADPFDAFLQFYRVFPHFARVDL